MSDAEWFYNHGNTESGSSGPIPMERLKSLFRCGTVSVETMVWNETFGDWMSVGDVPGLLRELKPKMKKPPPFRMKTFVKDEAVRATPVPVTTVISNTPRVPPITTTISNVPRVPCPPITTLSGSLSATNTGLGTRHTNCFRQRGQHRGNANTNTTTITKKAEFSTFDGIRNYKVTMKKKDQKWDAVDTVIPWYVSDICEDDLDMLVTKINAALKVQASVLGGSWNCRIGHTLGRSKKTPLGRDLICNNGYKKSASTKPFQKYLGPCGWKARVFNTSDRGWCVCTWKSHPCGNHFNKDGAIGHKLVSSIDSLRELGKVVHEVVVAASWEQLRHRCMKQRRVFNYALRVYDDLPGSEKFLQTRGWDYSDWYNTMRPFLNSQRMGRDLSLDATMLRNVLRETFGASKVGYFVRTTGENSRLLTKQKSRASPKGPETSDFDFINRTIGEMTVDTVLVELENGREFWKRQENRSLLFLDTTHGTTYYGYYLSFFATVLPEGATMPVAYALQRRQDESSFRALYRDFEKLFGTRPKLVWTDRDRAMKAALRSWPSTRHGLCLFHISENFADMLIRVIPGNMYGSLRSRCQRMFWKVSTEHDSKFCDSIVRELRKIGTTIVGEVVKHLGSTEKVKEDWEKRKKKLTTFLETLESSVTSWASCWVAAVFSAGAQSTQRSESLHASFKSCEQSKLSFMDLNASITKWHHERNINLDIFIQKEFRSRVRNVQRLQLDSILSTAAKTLNLTKHARNVLALHLQELPHVKSSREVTSAGLVKRHGALRMNDVCTVDWRDHGLGKYWGYIAEVFNDGGARWVCPLDDDELTISADEVRDIESSTGECEVSNNGVVYVTRCVRGALTSSPIVRVFEIRMNPYNSSTSSPDSDDNDFATKRWRPGRGLGLRSSLCVVLTHRVLEHRDGSFSCSCQHLTRTHLPCCHILAAFKCRDPPIEETPEPLMEIMKSWSPSPSRTTDTDVGCVSCNGPTTVASALRSPPPSTSRPMTSDDRKQRLDRLLVNLRQLAIKKKKQREFDAIVCDVRGLIEKHDGDPDALITPRVTSICSRMEKRKEKVATRQRKKKARKMQRARGKRKR